MYLLSVRRFAADCLLAGSLFLSVSMFVRSAYVCCTVHDSRITLSVLFVTLLNNNKIYIAYIAVIVCIA